MKKQFCLNLSSKDTPNFLINNENIATGDINAFNEVKNNIEVLYLISDVDSKFELSDNYVIFESKNIDDLLIESYVRHPYKSEIIEIVYSDNEEIIGEAEKNKKNISKKLEEQGFGKVHVTSVAYGKDGKLLSAGTNSNFHLENGCVRKELGCKSGEGYELCEGCQPINHGEQNAIKNAVDQGIYEELKGAIAYMFGHYWACESCTKAMEKAGIIKLFISKSFTKEFLDIQEIL